MQIGGYKSTLRKEESSVIVDSFHLKSAFEAPLPAVTTRVWSLDDVEVNEASLGIEETVGRVYHSDGLTLRRCGRCRVAGAAQTERNDATTLISGCARSRSSLRSRRVPSSARLSLKKRRRIAADRSIRICPEMDHTDKNCRGG